MALVYFDCFAGAGGDMIVAALIDAGADAEKISTELAKLGANGYEIRTEKVHRNGIAATKFTVEVTGENPPRRHLSEILELIDTAEIAPRARKRAKDIFIRLGQAEAKVHDIDISEVHFHEVGAIDSIIDIVGACLALELLDIDEIICSPIPVGSGTIDCAHGSLPAPSPATAELLRGVNIVHGELAGEVTTPTAAAILTTLADNIGAVPEMNVDCVGYGAGTREDGKIPNLLRVLIGKGEQDGSVDTVVELSANIDDCNGEIIGATIDKLLSAGCLDAWATPAFMKKSRPAFTLSVLCLPGDVEAVERIIFSETSTFGIRRRTCHRSKLSRHWETLETAYGPIRIKVGTLGKETLTASPEFEDCLKAAQTHHVSAREVVEAAKSAYRDKCQGNG